jgi:hypothetical protein
MVLGLRYRVEFEQSTRCYIIGSGCTLRGDPEPQLGSLNLKEVKVHEE